MACHCGSSKKRYSSLKNIFTPIDLTKIIATKGTPPFTTRDKALISLLYENLPTSKQESFSEELRKLGILTKIQTRAIPGKPRTEEYPPTPGIPSKEKYVMKPFTESHLPKDVSLISNILMGHRPFNLDDLEKINCYPPITKEEADAYRAYSKAHFTNARFTNATGKGIRGGDIVSGISSALEKVGLELPELHLPGHSFTGPGTDLKRRLNKNDKPKPWSKPINRIDETALRHDLCYRDNPDRNYCDKVMLKELDSIPNPSLREKAERVLVKTVIGTKAKIGVGTSTRGRTGGSSKDSGTMILQTVLIRKDGRNMRSALSWMKRHDLPVYKVDETRNFYRFRQEDPSLFREGSYRTKELPDGSLLVYGELR